MRLRRIEAVRYGSLSDATLGDFSDGLTVVLGPNEAGKSTYTALVRHVLYGYPTQKAKERGYDVPGDGRLARLVFDDEKGVWAIERGKGAGGGTVRTYALEGEERPGLLAELTEGVSALAYRVVFGFGLEDMAKIETERGSGDDVLSRLYAASAGLRVSPQEVRAALEKEAAAIFLPSARARELNVLQAELQKVRDEQRELRRESEALAEDQARLAELSQRRAGLGQARERARARATEMKLALAHAEERLRTIADEEQKLADLEKRRASLEQELASLSVDGTMLSAAPELDALLDEVPVQLAALESIRELETAVEGSSGRLREAVMRSGLPAEVLLAFGEGLEDADAIEDARESLEALTRQRDERAEALEKAERALDQAQTAAQDALAHLGLDLHDRDAIDGRLAALEELESLREDALGRPRRGPDPSAVIMVVSGIVAGMSGLYLREWAAAGIGAVLLAVGLWFVIRQGLAAPKPAHDTESACLSKLGLPSDASSLDIKRLRRSLDEALHAVDSVDSAFADRDEAAQELAFTERALSAHQASWSDWLEKRGLPKNLTPRAAAAVSEMAREARSANDEKARRSKELSIKIRSVEGFLERFVVVAGPHVEVPASPAIQDVPVLARHLKERLGAARAVAETARKLEQDLAHVSEDISGQQDRLGKAHAELEAILSRFGISQDGSVEDLRAEVASALVEESEVEQEWSELVDEMVRLEERLEKAAREQRGVELGLLESGLVERLQEAVDRYLVSACAARIVSEAQARYEREQQPEVVREAGRFFSMMTRGRYTSLAVPLGAGLIEAYDAHAAAVPSDLLSRGTAEQLYLSIRLGLITRLGEVGSSLPVLMDDVLVNFDPERREGAAEAIVELARQRQVIFFTCHPEVAEVLEDASGACKRIDIGRVGP